MSEYKRMQQLAGILNESETTDYMDELFKEFTEIEGSYDDVMEFLDSNDLVQLQYLYEKAFDYSPEGLDQDDIKSELYDYWENPGIYESTIIDKNSDPNKAADIAKREGADVNTVQNAIKQAKATGKSININETDIEEIKHMKKSQFKDFLKEEIRNTLRPASINEMAAIKGDIKTRVDQLIADNPDMEVGPLARMIMKDEEINDIINRDDLTDMAQNQTQKYIKLARGERELQQRGRKASPKPSDEEPLNEMAKLSGDLADAIGAVLANNDDLEGLALKKAIKADPAVIAALGDDTLYDNQLNRFIALLKGERENGQRGRKAISTDKPKAEEKPQPAASERAKPAASTSAPEKSLKDLVDDEDDAEVEDSWTKVDNDFDDDFQDDDKGFSQEDTTSLDKEKSSGLKDQETKKFWRAFVSRMKDEGIIGTDNKPIDKEQLEVERKKAQTELNDKLKNLK